MWNLLQLLGQLILKHSSVSVCMCMYIICQHFFSANAWIDLSKLSNIPSLGKLKAKVYELNSSFDIYATPGDTLGAQQSLKTKLTERVVQLLEEAPRTLLSGL